jgi:hypothetical protein
MWGGGRRELRRDVRRCGGFPRVFPAGCPVIHYVTGPLGAGKSFFAVRTLGNALLRGKAVATNIALRPDWAEVVARHNQYVRYSRRARREYAIELRTRFLYEPSLERLTHVQVRGHGESRALLLLDEAHNDLNNRDWQKEESKEFLRWLTLVRKKGFEAYVISQHKDNTDAGARRIATTQIQLVNWKQVTRVPVLDVSLLPVPMFTAICTLNSESLGFVGRTKPLWKKRFLLSWHRKLYGTHQLFGEELYDPDAIYLPRSRAEVIAELDGGRDSDVGSLTPPGVGLRPRTPVDEYVELLSLAEAELADGVQP